MTTETDKLVEMALEFGARKVSMTHPYTKLAEELESYTGDGHGYQVDDAVLREAASILRAAAAVDVRQFMSMVDEHGLANYREGLDDKSGKGADATDVTIKRSEIESALRMALAQKAPEPNTAGGAFFQQCTAFTAPKGKHEQIQKSI